jgi:molybdopterin/thiamine biosynthesis adenylyltransferase
VLDFIAKMPVAEIRLFDDDLFYVHNAYRKPGSTTEADFNRLKVEVYAAHYGTFHRNIRPFPMRITADDHEQIIGSHFVFVCVDSGEARMAITRALMDLGIPFVDVGMGLSRTATGLMGLVRTTLVMGGEWNELIDSGKLPIKDAADDVYSSNIQIAELNALNACMAVIQFKRQFGFFVDDAAAPYSLFDVGDSATARHEAADDEDDADG